MVSSATSPWVDCAGSCLESSMETPSEQVRYGNSAAKKQTHRYFCHTAAIFFFTQLPCREPNIRGAHPLRHLHGRHGHRLLRESRQHDGRVHRLPERKLPHTGQPPQTQHPQGALRALRHGQPEAGNRLRLSGVLDRGPEIRPAARGALFRPLAQNTEVKNRNADAVRSFGHRLFCWCKTLKVFLFQIKVTDTDTDWTGPQHLEQPAVPVKDANIKCCRLSLCGVMFSICLPLAPTHFCTCAAYVLPLPRAELFSGSIG